MANVKQSVAQFEQCLDSALKSTSTLVATMPATIEKQVSRAMSKHMSPRVIDQDLRQVLTPPDPDAIIEGGGNIQFNNDDQDGIITDPLNPPHINELLPKTKVLLRPNRRSSFYVGKGRKAVAKALKSPLERSFEVGCNDDMLYTTSSVPGSLTSTQHKHKKATKTWLMQQLAETKAKTAELCIDRQFLKRTPLPSTFHWNGEAGPPLEKYIDKLKGHVAQQQHLGYILLDSMARLWIKHGDPGTVLLMGMQQRLHPCLSNITTNQFISDIVWLYGALQQSLTGRGRNIVMEYETSQDGILTYRKFIATYRYDGNVSVYIASQQAILKVEFTQDYPGGMLKFVEDYETAFMNIDYVLRDHPILEDDGIPMQGFYTDAGKKANVWPNLFTQ